MGSLAAGSSAAMGTGAFSSVSANRSVDVAVAADSNAFLALEDGDSDFVTYDDSVLEINLDGKIGEGDGINDEARYQLGHVATTDPFHYAVDDQWIVDDGKPTEKYAFVITNQGTTSYSITIDGNFGDTGYRGSYQAHVQLGVYDEEAGIQYGDQIDSGGGGPTVSVGDIGSGDSIYVSILFDTTRPNVEVGSDDLDGSFTISAE